MLLLVLIVTTMLSALGLGLMTMTSTETAIASNYREASEVLHAADAAADCAIAEVSRAATYTDVLSGAAVSAWRDVNMTPILASGQRLDVQALTTTLQASSDAALNLGVNNPQWRLFINRSLSAITGRADAASYVAAWVSDDAADGDGNPMVDSNGLLAVRAQAFGRYGTSRTVDVTIAKYLNTRILSWREVR